MALEVSSVPLSLTMRRRPAAPGDDGVQFARDPRPRQRGVGDQRQALAGAVVDHRQDAEAPAVGHLVGDEVQAPALVGDCRGTSIGRRVPMARLRPPRRRTVSRSSR